MEKLNLILSYIVQWDKKDVEFEVGKVDNFLIVTHFYKGWGDAYVGWGDAYVVYLTSDGISINKKLGIYDLNFSDHEKEITIIKNHIFELINSKLCNYSPTYDKVENTMNEWYKIYIKHYLL